MYKVCGAIHWVYDPRGFVGQDTGLPFGNRLLPNETAQQGSVRKTQLCQQLCAFVTHNTYVGDGGACAAHQCASSPNSSLIDAMMIFSTLSSVLVTRSTVEVFVMTLISLSPAFLIS